MKNKNGFTLIEILAVIAILCILVTIATFSVMKTKENSMKKLLNIKIGELEASGILYGQENQEELNLKCTIDNEKYEFCTKKTVKELIDTDYYKSNEVNSSGQKDLLNNVTNESMLNDVVMIYKKNNRVYAKYIDSETESGIEIKPNPKPNPEPNPEPEPEVSCPNIKDVCKGGDNLANCIISLSQKCKLDVPEIYHHDSSLINGAGDNSYRYAGGDYVLTDAGKATGATMLIGYNNSLTTALIDFYCNGTKQYVGYVSSSCSTRYYQIKGDTTQYQTYNEALSASVEKGYLTKDNVKNFVCFGSNASTCPTENLYRIIGVFNNQVKLVKWDYAKSSLLGTDGDYSKEYSYCFSGEQGESPLSNSLYYWNYKATNSAKNTWSTSLLNKINLNTNFINNIGTNWANKIAITTWKVGGNTNENIVHATPPTAYKNEIVSPAENTTYEAKIGLIYVSDYYYAARPSAWTLVGNTSDDAETYASYASAKGEIWLYGGGWDWTISRNSGIYFNNPAFYVFIVNSYGIVFGYSGAYDNYGVRPAFSLLPSITYVSGSGSMSDPVRVN